MTKKYSNPLFHPNIQNSGSAYSHASIYLYHIQFDFFCVTNIPCYDNRCTIYIHHIQHIDIYKKNNRLDLLEVEQNEYDILTSFLPKQLSEEETKKICADVISKIGANSLKDMGKVMGELKKTHADEIDFSKAGSMIKELLNK